MHVVAMIAQKGGSGRTTLSINLAGHAQQCGVASLIIDLDPQGSATSWSTARHDAPPDVTTGNPASLERELTRARADGYGLVILDTPPLASNVVLAAARAADIVLIPVKPNPFDLTAVPASLDLCALAKRWSAVVISQAPIRSRVVAEASDLLRNRGAVICPVVVHQRVAFVHATIDGRTAAEYEPNCAAAVEIADLYDYMLSCLHDNKLSG